MKTCVCCGKELVGKSSRAKYCDETCRKRVQRRGPAAEVVNFPAPVPVVPVERPGYGPIGTAVYADLEAANRVGTVAGQMALALANRMDNGSMETGAGYTSVAKQLRETLAEAVAGAQKVNDPVDELRARRDRKLGTG